ncbi:MAG: hypothetical protein GEV11_01495 [Streptosporangiales bacterium]|nr:hypothetical protein [Streptosporangiales bacterium]
MTAAPERSAPEAARPTGGRLRTSGLTVFLGVLVVVLAFYTQQALGMEWRTTAGRIGPGFFPRIIGVIGIVLCVAAAIRSLRREPAGPEGAADAPEGTAAGDTPGDAADGDRDGPPDLGTHPRVLLGIAAALLVLVTFFIPLGALVGGALFMFAVFWVLGDRRPLRDAAFSVLVPLVLYLLFEVFLEAGLPEGIVPLP